MAPSGERDDGLEPAATPCALYMRAMRVVRLRSKSIIIVLTTAETGEWMNVWATILGGES